MKNVQYSPYLWLNRLNFYRNSSFTVYLAMGQIPHSTEHISSEMSLDVSLDVSLGVLLGVSLGVSLDVSLGV